MRKLLFVIALLVAVTAAADPVEEVRQAEIGFAKAFADRDQAKFFAFVTDDANFLGGLSTQKGKAQVVERWSRFFKGPEAPFSWGPERVVVNGNGTLGLSTGPVFDPAGKHVGNYSSIWQKQGNGAWKILFDGVGPAVAALPENVVKFEEGFVKADDGVKLYYRKIGEGPLTIIAPLDFAVFDDFKSLADIATVITYDLRNRGKSDRVADFANVGIQFDVKDLEAVRRELKVEKFTPIGFSYLGKMVAMYTLEHPDRVNRVIQLGPVAINAATKFPKELTHGTDDVAITSEEYRKWQDLRAQGAAEKTPKEFCAVDFNVFAHVLVGDAKHASRIRSWCELENEWPSHTQPHFQKIMESITGASLTKDDLQKLTMPVLTIHGTFDRNAPYGGGREWAMTLPNARLVTVEGAAHVSWADDPIAVFGSIREFLRGNWPLGAEKVTVLDPER